MISFGIMQGRLTEPKGRGIQFFPFDNWENEFAIAAGLGLNEIEFIFDLDRYEENPLWTKDGINRIKELIEKNNVKINSICFDYFMRRPFYKEKDSENQKKIFNENKYILQKIIEAATQIGARLIEIPLVDNSSIKNNEEEKLFIDFINDIASSNSTILFGLETDFQPYKFREVLDSIKQPNIRANYDSGNSSGLGYDHYIEVTVLNKYIENIHIKDRKLGGTTVELGTGSADFDKFFKAVKEIGYKNSYILQAARAEEGKEAVNITKQLEFVKSYLRKYDLLNIE